MKNTYNREKTLREIRKAQRDARMNPQLWFTVCLSAGEPWTMEAIDRHTRPFPGNYWGVAKINARGENMDRTPEEIADEFEIICGFEPQK